MSIPAIPAVETNLQDTSATGNYIHFLSHQHPGPLSLWISSSSYRNQEDSTQSWFALIVSPRWLISAPLQQMSMQKRQPDSISNMSSSTTASRMTSSQIVELSLHHDSLQASSSFATSTATNLPRFTLSLMDKLNGSTRS
jgi:hypothetical protein